MLARDDTARQLTAALLGHLLRSRVFLVVFAAELVAALVAGWVVHLQWVGIVLLGMALLTPVTLAWKSWRGARAMAPAGFTLGLGLGPHHLAVRHAIATTVLPYSSWKSAQRVGGVVLLRVGSGLIPLPLELFGPDLARVQALVGGPEDSPAGVPAGPDLPLQLVCTAATRAQVARALLQSYARRPAVIATAALLAVTAVLTLLSRQGPSPLAVIAPSVAVLAFAVEAVSTWRRLTVTCGPGRTMRALVLDDALVLEDATGRATFPFRSIRRVTTTKDDVLIRSALRSVIPVPRALLPDPELARMQSAVDWYRSRR